MIFIIRLLILCMSAVILKNTVGEYYTTMYGLVLISVLLMSVIDALEIRK